MKKLIKKIGIISATTIATLSSTIGFTTTAHAKVNPNYQINTTERYHYILTSDNDNCRIGEFVNFLSYDEDKSNIANNMLYLIIDENKKKSFPVYHYYKNYIATKPYVKNIQRTYQVTNFHETWVDWVVGKIEHYPTNKLISNVPSYSKQIFKKDYTNNPITLYNMPTKEFIDDSIKSYYMSGFSDHILNYEEYAATLKKKPSTWFSWFSEYNQTQCDEIIDYILNTGNYNPTKKNHKIGWKMGSTSYFERNLDGEIYTYKDPYPEFTKEINDEYATGLRN